MNKRQILLKIFDSLYIVIQKKKPPVKRLEVFLSQT